MANKIAKRIERIKNKTCEVVCALRRGKANGAGGHLGSGSFENITCPRVRPPGNSVHALNGAEQFMHTTWLFICATFLSPTAAELLIDPRRAPFRYLAVDSSRSNAFIITGNSECDLVS